jgi:hypothetical protein
VDKNRDEHQEGTQYPCTYTVEARVRRDLDAIAISWPTVFVCMAALHLVGITPKNNNVTLFDLLTIVFATGLVAVFGIGHTHSRVVLYQDAIEVLGWFSSRRLQRSEILGYRLVGLSARQAMGAPYYIIIPVDRTARNLILPSCLHVDKDFHSWMSEIPKLRK